MQAAAKKDLNAAEQGDADAQYALANNYILADGVPEDFVTAYAWLTIAADSGHERAVKKRASIKRTMNAANMERAEQLAKEIAERIEKANKGE